MPVMDCHMQNYLNEKTVYILPLIVWVKSSSTNPFVDFINPNVEIRFPTETGLGKQHSNCEPESKGPTA